MSVASSGSDQTTFNGENSTTPVALLATAMLASLSEIIALVASIDRERNLIEFGCYMYRVTPAIAELRSIEYFPINPMKTLRSLHENIRKAAETLKGFEERIPIHELNATLRQLEGVIRLVGEDLSSLPFGDQDYAQIAIRSLSEEMKNANLIQENDPKSDSSSTYSPNSSLQVQVLKNANLIQENDPKLDSSSTYSPNSSLRVQVLRSISTLTEGNSGYASPTSIKTMQDEAQYVEPVYKSFVCPLTKAIMDDPVTIQSGVTYERRAITEWFKGFVHTEEVTCPITGEKVQIGAMSANIALKAIIVEWKDRNESARIKVIRLALSKGGSESMMLDAMEDLLRICERSEGKREEVRNVGMIPLLVKFLEYRDWKVRCCSLKVLYILAQQDEGKELIGKTAAITATVRMLSSSHQAVKQAALLLLAELSKSRSLSEKIGWVTGGILMLIKIKYDRAVDAFASETADQVVKNLAQSPYNIKCMAENGFIDPLLDSLQQGSDEMQLKMASYLGEIVLGHTNSSYVAEKASSSLIQMMCSGNPTLRKAAMKAFAQLSSYSNNGIILVETGVLRIIVEEMFMKESSNEWISSAEDAAVTLANVLESGIEIKDLDEVNAVSNIVQMITKTNQDEVNVSLIKILSCLTKSPKLTASLVAAIKEIQASYRLVSFINHPNEELGISTIRLMIILSSQIGHMLAERICKTDGLVQGLIQSPTNISQITERQVLSAKLLAILPHRNIRLNLALIEGNAVVVTVKMIDEIRRSGAIQSRHAGSYLESMVGILVRFTATIYEPEILSSAINYGFADIFADIFADLLIESSSDAVKILAATGLEKLSSQSIVLSRQPKNEKRNAAKFCCISSSSGAEKVSVCAVHGGVCSSKNTFCLIEGKGVEGLLACLNHKNVEVVEAALSGLSTLLDERLATKKSVAVLNEMNAAERIMRVVRDHKKESLLQKVFWMIERFLIGNGQGYASVVAQDRVFAATVVNAFHHGDPYTKQMAEKILRYLNKMPMYTTTFTNSLVT